MSDQRTVFVETPHSKSIEVSQRLRQMADFIERGGYYESERLAKQLRQWAQDLVDR